MNRLDTYQQQFMKKRVPNFDVGDTVDVVIKIMEGDKERRQTFSGTVISRKGSGLNETFIVRRIVQGEGVERVFPIHSPKLVTLRVKRKGKVRRAKLFYLRDRVGKATKVQEKIWNVEDAKISAQETEDAAKESEAPATNKQEKQ